MRVVERVEPPAAASSDLDVQLDVDQSAGSGSVSSATGDRRAGLWIAYVVVGGAGRLLSTRERVAGQVRASQADRLGCQIPCPLPT